ncbi:MAG: aminomethyl-transferring glycine dehydrogenase subunit GcvPA, partial [Nitrospinota bacterium]|nr:aminomethyl-transferring glycine dehydrogenase subunit GcvPA [Nitrospinota bacterium]
RITGRPKVIMPDTVHPHWRQVAQTYTQHMGIEIVSMSFSGNGAIDAGKLIQAMGNDTAAVVVQSPNFFGCLEDMAPIGQAAHAAGALLIGAVAEPVSLGLLKGPGAHGADIAVAEGMAFGGSLSFGGPGLGMFAVGKDHARRMPGRLVGKTKDTRGREGYTLTLATREQHIRREKATSNICSNQALMATSAAIHISLLGAEGLQTLAERNLAAAHYLAGRLTAIPGVKLAFDRPFFNEFAVTLPVKASRVVDALSSSGFLPGLEIGRFYPGLKDTLLFCATEVHTSQEMDMVAQIVAREVK